MSQVITNSIGMKLALIPPGEFLMGSPNSDTTADDAEKPQHPVRITKAFYLGVYPVGQKKPNAWGLHDMHGNVWEWCRDGWEAQYKEGPADDPEGYAGSAAWSRVGRGGSWGYPAEYCRSASRLRLVPNDRNGGLGF